MRLKACIVCGSKLRDLNVWKEEYICDKGHKNVFHPPSQIFLMTIAAIVTGTVVAFLIFFLNFIS